MKTVGRKPTQKRKSNSKNRVSRKEKSSKKKGKIKMLKEKEELNPETILEEENNQKEFEEDRKLTMWLTVSIISISVLSLITVTAPKGNMGAKAINYDLNCLTTLESVKNPLNNCRL